PMLRRASQVGLAVAVSTAMVMAGPMAANAHGKGPHPKPPGYTRTDLVSDEPGKAVVTDPDLVNAWGMSRGPNSPIWVTNNGTNTSPLYTGAVGATPVTKVP